MEILEILSSVKKCNILENKIVDLHNTLHKFIKGRDNLNLFLCNQSENYNKVELGYGPKNSTKSSSNICHVNRTSKCNILRCNHCNKNDHVTLLCFIMKSNES